MKLTNLNVKNFIGIRAVNCALTTPVTIFAGKNGAGKSSLQEAIRMALTGETVRVGLKKDYSQLVTEGEKVGFAEVEIDGTIRTLVSLPSGKMTPMDNYVPPIALPYVLDAQRFARLDPNERRSFMFGLMGLSAGGAEVKRRLIERGCDSVKVESVMPMLRVGFKDAHEFAKEQAKEHKTEWRTITGETYGDKKAASWAAEKPAFDAAALADMQQHIAATDAGIATANQRLWGLQADHKRHIESAQQLAGLREKGSRYASIATKLAFDEAQLKEWETKVELTRQRASGGRKTGLIHEMAYAVLACIESHDRFHKINEAIPAPEPSWVTMCRSCVSEYIAQHGEIVAQTADHDPEAVAKLPEYEKALVLLNNAVINDKRDLMTADAAAKAINELEAAIGSSPPGEAEIQAARKHMDDLKAERSEITAKLDAQQDAERQAKQADERTRKALLAHESVLAWIAIADALAPDGIPGEMLSEALNPINERLAQSANDAGWTRINIDADMSVFASEEGATPRHYALLSESEKWRADAMLAEAVSHISKIKLMVLDRLDVLDMQGRLDLLAWLQILAEEGEIDTAMIFGTLKALPANLPDYFAAHWLENGVVAQFNS